MHFSTDWLDEAPNAAPEEAATACDLRVFVGVTNVTTHLDEEGGRVEDHVTMPAFSLALGLAMGWWRIFGGRHGDYSLLRHRMGYAVPDLRFRFDGLTFEASAEQKLYENPKIRFWTGPAEVISRHEAEDALSGFIEAVNARLTEQAIVENGLRRQWERVGASRADPEEALFCEAAGALGRDPYELPESDAVLIHQAGALFDGEPLLEFLAGIGVPDAAMPALEWVRVAEGRKTYRSRFPELGSMARQAAVAAPSRPLEPSWSLGYRRARALRRILGIEQSDRFATVRPLAQRLGSNAFAFAPWVEGVHALVTHENDDSHIFLRDRPSNAAARQSHLFSFARAVGDAICFLQTRRSVVNDLHEASRQATGRAFAAEFLAPVDEILSMKADGRDNESIAEDFGVSTVVIGLQIENRHRVESVCAA